MSEMTLPPALRQIANGKTSHPGISRAYKLLHTEDKVFIIHNFAKHSLLSVSRFHSNTTLASGMLANTTGVGCKDLRLRFIIYQLLQAVSFLHDKGLCLDTLLPSEIMLDDEMWVYLPIGLSNRLLTLASLQLKEQLRKKKKNSGSSSTSSSSAALNQESILNYHKSLLSTSKVPRPVDYYQPLTIQWIAGKLTNFEYLMAINYAAGRTMIDPLYHPILPWVTDFTTNCFDVLEQPSYRDLSKTKFRLSKGDTQLETTFRHSDPPHHIPESLSELTYYIYLARRTPMQVLRRVVRDVFVPEHYPQSMHRIYEWTPDECIPEFYTDPSVFTSIHLNHGLTDLDVPSFITSADQFIQYHRQVLESDYVSENLHLWIDLTFGYCLEGDAAIQHMNVPLHHTLSSAERQGIDSPRLNKNPGFVMLFDSPHPVRQVSNPVMKSHIYRPTAALTTVDEPSTSGGRTRSLTLEAFVREQAHEKYQMKPIYLGNRSDYEGLEEFIELDHRGMGGVGSGNDQALSKLFRSYQRESQMLTGKNDAVNPTSPADNAAAVQKRQSRKSLARPPADSTWNKFRFIEDVDLISSDGRGYSSVNNFLLQTEHYKFTENTSAFIDGSYELPSREEFEKYEDVRQKSGRGKREDERNRKINSSRALPRNWDDEFVSAVELLQEIIENPDQHHHPHLTHYEPKVLTAGEEEEEEQKKEKELISKYQAEDMFAIGCMIAELYNGRSLLSKNDTYAIACGQLTFSDYMEKIYKRTSGMPLVLQRVISLLVHQIPSCRPRAKEIIETCIMQNAENSSFPPEDYLFGGEPLTVNNESRSFLSTASGMEISTSSAGISSQKLQSKDQIQRFARIHMDQIHRYDRTTILSDNCHALFPDYFATIYRIISSIKLAPDGLLRLNALINCVEELATLPIDGINLGLVHFLEVIGDSIYFTDNLQEKYSAASGCQIDVKMVLTNYWRIIDILGLRLGTESTEKFLVPHVVKFLSTFTAIDLLRDLLTSPLWNILALRAGIRCFLRSFLPILLTYLSAGTIHHVLVRKAYEYQHGLVAMGENIPLWTTANLKISEKDEWLKKSSILSIHRVQRAAVSAISNLSEIDSLGSAICARYIIPSLLSLVGVPQLASSGFEPRKALENESTGNNANGVPVSTQNGLVNAEFSDKLMEELVQQSMIGRRTLLGDNDRPTLGDINRVPYESENGNPSSPVPERLAQAWLNDRSLLESLIMKHATFNAEHMYVVKVIVEMGTKLGDVVISELILSSIVNIILPELESQLTTVPKQGTAAALMEIILLLNGLLPILSSETIHHDLLQPSRLSGTSIPRLLSIWPLAPAFSFLDDLGEDLIGQFNIMYAIENVRMHTVLLELCRLIVSMSMIVGPDLTSEYVLPHLDTFFKNFVSSYGIFPVESKTMLKAFELGAEIYLPLVQIVSAEAFYTSVPNLNPRLEMWLRGIGSNIPPKSPPLPANIWPEVTSEVTSRPEKKKPWIVQFFRGLSSSSSNSATGSSTTPATVVGNSSLASSTPSTTSASQRGSVALGSVMSGSLTRAKTHTVGNQDEYEMEENQFVRGDDSISTHLTMTPSRLKKGPFRTPLPHQTFSPTVGTELVSIETESSRKLSTAAMSTNLSLAISSHPTPAVNNNANSDDGPTTPTPTEKRKSGGKGDGGIVSILSLDDIDDMKQGTPYRKKRLNSKGFEIDESVKDGENRSLAESENSVDSDDEVDGVPDPSQLQSNDVSVVVMDDDDVVAASADHPLHSSEEKGPSKSKRSLPLSPSSPLLDDSGDVNNNLAGSARKLFSDDQLGNGSNSESLLDISVDHVKIVDIPPTVLIPNNPHPEEIIAPTPRILFSTGEDAQSTTNTESNDLQSDQYNAQVRVERKSLDDAKCPYRRYQRLLNNRAALKNQRYSVYHRDSPAKFRLLNRRNSTNAPSSAVSGRLTSIAHNPNTGLTSNSNYMIINAAPIENETAEEVEFRESRYSELTWLLAGYGRWNVDKEMKDRLNRELTKSAKHGPHSSGMKLPTSYYTSANEWNPAAQISMTQPKIAVDVANDSSTLINFQLQANTQWKLEDPPGMIKCMVTNANESLLMTCSRTGVRLFSLSTQPILHVSSYTNHTSPPFNAAFLRDGQHAMTCDGSIHLWDIESRQPLGIIIPVDKQVGYSSASVIPSRYGIHPSIDSVGDEQILATISDTVSYFDIRCNCSKPMNRVAEWILPQIPPLQGNFISSTVEPLQLTCAYSHENYVFAGSLTGGLYIIERRMGKLLNSWQAHDSSIIKINALSERHILAVSERAAAIWEYSPEVSHTTYPMSSLYPGTFSVKSYNKSIHNTPIAYHEFRDINATSSAGLGNSAMTNISLSMYHMGYGGIGEVKKTLTIKNPTDAIYGMNNIILTSFDNISPSYYNTNGFGSGPGSGGAGHHSNHANQGHGDLPAAMNRYAGSYENGSRDGPSNALSGLSASKAQKVLYCLSGHRMHSGFLPSVSDTNNASNNTFNRRMTPKDVSNLFFKPIFCY